MSIYKTFKPAGSDGGLYLKIQDGESVKIRIASEPALFTQEFNNDGETTVSTKFAWTVWNRNEKKAQVYSGGKSVYNQIADLVEEWGEPTTFDITVKRTGAMLETRYSVTPAPKSVDLTIDEQKDCNSIDLLKAIKGYWLKDFDQNGNRVQENAIPEDQVFETEEDLAHAVFTEYKNYKEAYKEYGDGTITNPKDMKEFIDERTQTYEFMGGILVADF